MAVALNGNLEDFGIAEVFQLIGQQRKTGLLMIEHARREVLLAFDAGSVVWAAPAARGPDEVLGQRLVRGGFLASEAVTALHDEAHSSGRPFRALLVAQGGISNADLDAIDSLVTHDTLFDVLRWTEGFFNFTAGVIEHSRPPEKLLGAEQILMDGLRMVDEWQTFRAKVPPLDAIVERTGDVAEHRERVRRDGESAVANFERIAALIDGRMTLQRVIDLSRLGLFDATRAIAALTDAGLIEARQKSSAKASSGRTDSTGRVWGKRVLAAVAAVIPLVLLGGLVFALARQTMNADVARLDAFPIERRVLDDARTMFEKRRIRHALEAHRYRTGAWPESLSELESGDWGTRGPMAGDPAAAYYYERGERHVVLVARERG